MSTDREDFKKAFEGSFSPELIEYIKQEQDKRIREDIERYTTLVDKLAGTVSSVPNWEKMYNEVIDAVAPWRAEDLTKDNFQLYLETIFERLCVTIEKHMNIIERYEKSKNKQSSPHEE